MCRPDLDERLFNSDKTRAPTVISSSSSSSSSIIIIIIHIIMVMVIMGGARDVWRQGHNLGLTFFSSSSSLTNKITQQKGL